MTEKKKLEDKQEIQRELNDMFAEAYHTMKNFHPTAWLHIHNLGRFEKRPRLWHRFWAWFLLGWRWEKD